MPILQTYQFSTFEVLIWNITEPLDFFIQNLALSKDELTLLQQKYRNPIAFKQWLASRCGLEQLFQTSHRAFQKNETGKLELKNKAHQLSLSHSDHYIAVAKAKQAIGLDLQVQTPKLERIASKYLAKELLIELKKALIILIICTFIGALKKLFSKRMAWAKLILSNTYTSKPLTILPKETLEPPF